MGDIILPNDREQYEQRRVKYPMEQKLSSQKKKKIPRCSLFGSWAIAPTTSDDHIYVEAVSELNE